MKLDWKIVRAVLQTLENAENPRACVKLQHSGEIEPQHFGYHCYLLQKRGLIEGRVEFSGDSDEILEVYMTSLTMEGHELLDLIRNETSWSRITSVFKNAGEEMTLAGVRKLGELGLMATLKAGFGLALGA